MKTILRRIAAVIPVMAVVAVVVFLLIHLSPGDPAAVIAGDNATTEDVEKIRQNLRLDKPLLDAALAVPGKDLPQLKGIKTAQGYSVLYIQKAQAGKPDPTLQASLPVELARAWGQAEEHAVLEALKAQTKIKILPQAEKVLAGDTEGNG